MKKISLLFILIFIITGCAKEKITCIIDLSSKNLETGWKSEEVVASFNDDNKLTDIELSIIFTDKNKLDENCGLFEMANEYAIGDEIIKFKCKSDRIIFMSVKDSLKNLNLDEQTIINKDKDNFIKIIELQGFKCQN